jgi:hypothetical protein
MTIWTRADLRWLAQSSSRRASTSGSGTSSRVCGVAGLTPLASLIGAATGTSSIPGRKPYSSTRSWFSGVCTYSTKAVAASFCCASTHSASSTISGLSL